MEAVIKSGGKQYLVREGDVIRVEKLTGKSHTFTPLLLTKDGVALKDTGTVTASAVGDGKSAKVVVFKMKAKKGYRRKAGHRQTYTELKIDSIRV